jgi:hypothetical protein
VLSSEMSGHTGLNQTPLVLQQKPDEMRGAFGRSTCSTHPCATSSMYCVSLSLHLPRVWPFASSSSCPLPCTWLNDPLFWFLPLFIQHSSHTPSLLALPHHLITLFSGSSLTLWSQPLTINSGHSLARPAQVYPGPSSLIIMVRALAPVTGFSAPSIRIEIDLHGFWPWSQFAKL